MYQSVRENLFYNAGFEHGLLAARQDNVVERMPNDPVARALWLKSTSSTSTTELPRNRVVMLLLEAAWAMVFGVGLPAFVSRSQSELAAIRSVLWPGGDMAATWSPDTIDEIAQIAKPKKGGG